MFLTTANASSLRSKLKFTSSVSAGSFSRNWTTQYANWGWYRVNDLHLWSGIKTLVRKVLCSSLSGRANPLIILLSDIGTRKIDTMLRPVPIHTLRNSAHLVNNPLIYIYKICRPFRCLKIRSNITEMQSPHQYTNLPRISSNSATPLCRSVS